MRSKHDGAYERGAGRRAWVPPPAYMESTQTAVIELTVLVMFNLSQITSEPKGILVDTTSNRRFNCVMASISLLIRAKR